MDYKEIVAKVAEDTGLPQKLVDRTYKCYWRVIREYIKALPLKEDLTDEEFMKLRPNVNIPSLGKLCVTLNRYTRVKKRNRITQELKNKKHVED